jgi:hypothetical protein
MKCLSIALALGALIGSSSAWGDPPASTAAAPQPSVTPNANGAAAVAQLKLGFPQSEPKLSTDGGSAYINVAVGGGRTQLVYLSSALLGPDGAKSRLLRSVAAKLAAPPEAGMLLRLLKENQTLQGYWYLAQVSNGQFYLNYAIALPLDATGEAVSAMSSDVARTADKLEQELSGKDEL